MDCASDVKFKFSLPSNRSKSFFLLLLFKQFMVLLVTFMFKFRINFEVFLVWNVKIRLNIPPPHPTHKCPAALAPFIEELIIPPLNQESIFVCFHFWVLDSVSLIYESISHPVLHSLDCWSYVQGLEQTASLYNFFFYFWNYFSCFSCLSI